MQVRAVVPQWFDDCFQQMMHLPEDPYEWPEPEILRCSSHVDGDPAKKKCVIPKPRRDLIRTALVTLPENDEALRVDKALAVITPNVWEGRKILLSQNLELERVLESVKVSIRRGGGVLVELDTFQDEDDIDDEELAKVSDADIYITQFRAGRAYLKVRNDVHMLGFSLTVHGRRSKNRKPSDRWPGSFTCRGLGRSSVPKTTYSIIQGAVIASPASTNTS